MAEEGTELQYYTGDEYGDTSTRYTNVYPVPIQKKKKKKKKKYVYI